MKRKLLFSLCILFVTVYSYGQLSENFEGAFPPTDWTLESGSGNWDKSSQTSDHTTGSGYFARYNCYSISGTAPAGLITPTLNVTSGDQTLVFWANYYLISGTYGNNSELYVDVSADNGNNWTTGTTNYISGQDGVGWFSTSIDLGNYEGQNFIGSSVIIRFSAISDWGSYNIGIDDVSGPEVYVPACPAPTTPTETNITSTSVDLSWTESGTATSWDIEYGATSYTFTGTPTITGVTNPYNLTGLLASTDYTWKVRADCGGGDYSDWTGPSSFTTACDAISTFTWTEDFDAAATTPGCWTNSSADAWKFSSVASGYGATQDHTSGTGNYAWVDDSSPYSNPSNFESPFLDITSLTTPLLSFWYWIGYGTTGSTLYVDVYDGTSWTEGVGTYSPNNGWIEATIDMSSYSSTTTQVRFRGMENESGFNCDICIDDVSVGEAPACPKPTALTEANISSTSADLSWTESGTATSWDIEYGATSYTFTGTPTITGVTNPHNLTGLLASTEYTWKVRADCGGGDFSDWVGPSTFITACEAIASFPHTEDFDGTWVGSPAAPLCWTVINANSDSYFWSRANTYIAPTHSPLYAAHGMGNTNDYLITPQLDLTGINARIKWWDKVESSTRINSYRVLVSTTTPEIASFTDDLGTYNCANTAWTEHILDLSAYTGQTIYVAFYQFASASTYYGFGIDDVTVEEIPACPNPFDLVTSSITTSGATLAWTAGSAETAWEYSYGAEGYGPPAGSGIAVVSPTADISGLNANQSYDWYVRADCGPSMSAWVGPENFNTLCDGVVGFPYEQDFENGGNMPDCWTQIHEIGTTDWGFTDGGYSSHPNAAFSGDFNARFFRSSYTSSTTWLVSPALDLSSATSPILEFWHAQAAWGSDQDELRVYYKTSAIGDWKLIPGAEWTGDIPDWTKAGFFLPEPSAEYYIGFKGTTNYGYGVVIDNIKITAVPPIPVSNWAIVLGLFLMVSILVFRFKR